VGNLRISNEISHEPKRALIAYFEWLFFKKLHKNVLCLNIEDITNITFVPHNVKREELITLTSGPGNILIDQMMQRLYELPFDPNGKKAFIGNFSQRLFDLLAKEDAFSQHAIHHPIGKKYYDPDFILKILRKAIRWRLSEPDVIHTVTKYTAFTIWSAWHRFIKHPIQLLIIGGKGSFNDFLEQCLKEYFKGIEIRNMSEFGLDEKFRYAICIAVLANEFITVKVRETLKSEDEEKHCLSGKIYLA
jgi:anhydro-N-acetylmuramic acid kinase